MDAEDRWAFLVALDEELLKGSVCISEWCTFIVKEADVAFVSCAHLAAILTAVSGIETFLRSERASSGRERLVSLIEDSSVSEELKADIHKLRKYRNRWVHVDDPWDDSELMENPNRTDTELEQMAIFAIRVLRKTIYSEQGT